MTVNSDFDSILKANKYFIANNEYLANNEFEIEMNQITLFAIDARQVISKAERLNISQVKMHSACIQIHVSREITFIELLRKVCILLKMQTQGCRTFINKNVIDEQYYNRTMLELTTLHIIHLNDLLVIDQKANNGKWLLGII